jgi:hypothetical protein
MHPPDSAEPTRPAARDRAAASLVIAAALGVVFAGLVAWGLHGFSLAAWHAVIDGSEPTEVLLGAPRLIRSDDWKVHLPLVLAQRAVEPRFPVVNPVIGFGQDMRVPLDAPVAHWSTLFRPQHWGFALGDDAGLAWLWWSRVFGLFGVWMAVFAIVARGSLATAALGAALLVASPFFALWAYNAAPQSASMGAVVLAGVALLRAETTRSLVVAAGALAAAGTWFALALYPPYQVTLAWLAVALGIGLLLDARGTVPFARRPARGLAAALAAIAMAVAIVALFAAETRDAIEAIRNTVYPGRRLATGGDRSVAELLNTALGAPLWASDWGTLHNECEDRRRDEPERSRLALVAWRAIQRERVDPVLAVLGLYVGLVGLYAVVGIPEWLARATGLGLAPGRRTVIGLGLADAAILVRFAATARPAASKPALAIAAVWLATLAACVAPLARTIEGASLPLLAAFAAGNAALAVVVLRRPRWGLVAVLLLSLVSTFGANPLARGGSEWLRENELSRTIREIDRSAGGDTVWLSFGRDDVGNLFRMLGIRSLGGVQPIPQQALWERIDPERTQRRVWDRYAHVAFVASMQPAPRFQLFSQDFVIVHVDPRSAAFRALGATHVLVRADDAPGFEKLTGWAPIAVSGPNHLYAVPAPTTPEP